MPGPVRPPSDIRLVCTADAHESTTWTDAWNHQLDEHAADHQPWDLVGTETP